MFLFFGLFTKKKGMKFPADTHTHIEEFIKEEKCFCTPTHYLIYPPHRTVRANIYFCYYYSYVYPRATETFFGSTESLALILRYIIHMYFIVSAYFKRGDDVEFIFYIVHWTSHLAQFHTHTHTGTHKKMFFKKNLSTFSEIY